MPNRRRPVNGDALPSPALPTSAEVLRERVYNNERITIALQGEVHEIRSTMATQDDVRNLHASMAGIAAKLDQMGKTNWPVLLMAAGFLLAFVTTVGTLAYLPVKDKQAEQAASLQKLEDRSVGRIEYAKDLQYVREADSRRKGEIDDLRKEIVPRNEVITSTSNLQRQVDEIRRDVGGVVTTRDVLQQQAKRIEQLEGEIRTYLIQRRPAP